MENCNQSLQAQLFYTHFSLHPSVPDRHSCKQLVSAWCICRYHVMVDCSGGWEASPLLGFHPRFSTCELKMPGELCFAHPTLRSTIFVAPLCIITCRVGSGIKTFPVCSCFSASLGRGFDAALGCSCECVGVGVKD